MLKLCRAETGAEVYIDYSYDMFIVQNYQQDNGPVIVTYNHCHVLSRSFSAQLIISWQPQ